VSGIAAGSFDLRGQLRDAGLALLDFLQRFDLPLKAVLNHDPVRRGIVIGPFIHAELFDLLKLLRSLSAARRDG
jgi:hypothetical protein